MLSQSAPKKHNQEKKPTNLCAPWISPKNVSIIQSCYFDYRINKLFACSRCVICVFWSRPTTRAKDHRLSYLNHPQIHGIGKSDHVVYPTLMTRNSCQGSPPNPPWSYPVGPSVRCSEQWLPWFPWIWSDLRQISASCQCSEWWAVQVPGWED